MYTSNAHLGFLIQINEKWRDFRSCEKGPLFSRRRDDFYAMSCGCLNQSDGA